MRKLTTFILFSVFLILIIPAFALLGGNIKNSVPKQNNIISKTDLEENNFYLIKDAQTNEVMKLTPSDYIKGVVAAEMPIDFHSEALKAQAVAAHTYALRQIDEELKTPTPELDGAYLSTDYTKFQAYISTADLKIKWGKDFDLNYKKLSNCVDSVINDVLTYDNAPIAAAFHSISSGKTESAKNVWGQDISYLSPVDSVGDELSPSFENTVTLTDQEVAHAISLKFPDVKFSKDRAK
ncbi:MAG: SpoIID/LytB domain-containing protein, partial [Oscillospiraceae bacterium]